MKIAYLAPEIPALSATFVYKEILKLKSFGVKVVPFSVHRPLSEAVETELNDLKKEVVHLYESSKTSVFRAHVFLLLTRPLRYLNSGVRLLSDIVSIGLFSRNAIGLVFRFFYAGTLAKALIKQDCQHLHVHFAHVPTDIAMYASLLSGVSYSVTAHANDLFERGWLLKEKVGRSAFFATISEFNKRFLAEKGIDIGTVRIVRCGVDDEQFEQRQSFVSGSTIKVGVVGRLVEKKGIDTLIRAIAVFRKQRFKVKLYIAGSGPMEQALKALVIECGLSIEDVFFIGALPNSYVAAFIASLDMFVLPCKMDESGDMDGIPVVLMEAMLSGVPVISTVLSGIPELICHRQTGLLVKPGDSEGLAAAMLLMMSDAELRDGMCAEAISRVKREFSLNVNTKILYEMFGVVINGNK